MANPIFDTENTPPVENEPIDTSEVTSDTLVGEGRKYKTADDLAKAYANADAHIAQTKAVQAEKDAEIKVLKDLLEANQSKPSEAPGDKVPVNNDDSRDNKQVPVDQNRQQNDDADLAKLIREGLDKAQEEKKFSDNVDQVANKLTDHFGSEAKANQYIRDKAKELSVPVDWMLDVAGKSPSAFFNTVGFSTQGTSTATPNSSTGNEVNPSAFRNNNQGVRNHAHYEKIRKDNPKLYYSSDTQRNLMIDARKQGPDFFNN